MQLKEQEDELDDLAAQVQVAGVYKVPLRPLAPLPGLVDKRFFFYTIFGQKDPYFSATMYFKKLKVKYCDFADCQHNTLILIFGYFVLNKIYLIFKRLKILKINWEKFFVH